jgi:mono/diheme cytochrome c family protein
MRRASLGIALIVPLGAAALIGSGSACAAPAGAEIFAAHCAVCHGAKAEGIPGSFPPLAAQISTFAATLAGRDYLVMAVSAGLIGGLSVAGGSYQGAMPAQTLLSEAEVAAVLNYLASGQRKSKSGAALFNEAEVSAVRARHAGVTGPAALALRPSLPDR